MRSAPDGDGRFARLYFQDGWCRTRSAPTGVAFVLHLCPRSLAYAFHPRPDRRWCWDSAPASSRCASRRAASRWKRWKSTRLAGGGDPLLRLRRLARARAPCRCPHELKRWRPPLRRGDRGPLPRRRHAGLPHHARFFSDLRRCLGSGGVPCLTLLPTWSTRPAYAHLLATLRTELPYIALYRPDFPGAIHVNSFIVAGAAPLPQRGKSRSISCRPALQQASPKC